MFFVNSPNPRTLSRFEDYLRSRDLHVVTLRSVPQEVALRQLTAAEAASLLQDFTVSCKLAGIGNRHGDPMRFHFLLREESPGQYFVEHALIENMHDLDEFIEYIFIFAEAVWKVHIASLTFPCAADSQIEGYSIERVGEALVISRNPK